jgi:predicted MFS family arabinose efflux permease
VGEPLGYQLVLMLAFGVGLIAVYQFSQLPEHAISPVDKERFGLRETFRGLRSYPNFKHFVLAHAVLNLGVTIGGPFIQVYMVQSAGFDVATISVVNTIGVASAMVAMYLFGRLQDRYGITWIMRFTVAMPIVPVLWLWVEAPWQAALVQFYASLSWTGYTLGSFNLLLAITPEAHRPHYIALHATIASVVGALGPVVGGWLLDATGFLLVFCLSTILRSIGLILFLARVREPDPAPGLAASPAPPRRPQGRGAQDA